MTVKRKILFTEKLYACNYALQDFSPPIFFLIRKILNFFVNCLINLKSQCELIPFIYKRFENKWRIIISRLK